MFKFAGILETPGCVLQNADWQMSLQAVLGILVGEEFQQNFKSESQNDEIYGIVANILTGAKRNVHQFNSIRVVLFSIIKKKKRETEQREREIIQHGRLL